MVIRKKCDFCVCGGGLAGLSAAIAAARQGLKVILCNDRATLGGNSSSEFRVWISGASALGNNRYADEGGIIGELALESLYRNKEGNPHLWDILLLDTVLKEKNIELLQNARVMNADLKDNLLSAVKIYQHTTERHYVIEADYYADCTGDGYLAVKAGAEWVYGNADQEADRQSVSSYEEKKSALGSTIFFYKKLCDHPVKYVRPDFAYPWQEIARIIRETGKVVSLKLDGCDYWWLEYGGELDSIQDSEMIQYELLKIVYGLWDYIKNSGEFESDRYTLEWVGMLPGRRESRRILAKHTLTTQEIHDQQEFEDAVAYGGWPVDLHPSAGFFDERESCNQMDTSVYSIPLGSLLCRDVDNLFLAGRNAGMTHGAMASARVMKTCALMGQAAGSAAAFAVRYNQKPHLFDKVHLHQLQQQLLKDDVWLIGVPNQDPEDLAGTARLEASPPAVFRAEHDDGFLPLDQSVCIILPPLPQNTCVKLVLNQKVPHAVKVEVYCSSRLQNHDLARKIEDQSILPGPGGQVSICAPWGEYNTILKISADADTSLGLSKLELPGALGVISENAKGYRIFRPAIHVAGDFNPYAPQNLTDGFNRPYGHMHMWAAPLGAKAPYVEFTLEEATDIRQIHLYFDCSLFRGFNNLRPAYSHPEWDQMPPNLVRDATVTIYGEDVQKNIRIQDNRRRHLIVYPDAKAVNRVRITFHNSWGEKLAAVYEARIYGSRAHNTDEEIMKKMSEV